MSDFPSRSDLNALMSGPSSSLDMVLPGFLRGTVGGLVSPGGVGKSYWALQLALGITGGASLDTLGLYAPRGKVLMLAAEDPDVVIRERLMAMSRVHSHLSGDTLADLDYRSCLGLNLDVMVEPCYSQIAKAGRGCRLIILDTLTRFHNLDENAAQDMKRLLARLEGLARETGAAVLYLHHTSKAAVVSGQGGLQQAARGSSVLVDNVRWLAFMACMTEGEARRYGIAEEKRQSYVRWNISKQNYGAPHADRWFFRDEGGVLVPTELKVCSKRARREQTAEVAEPALLSSGPLRKPGVEVLPSAKNAYDGNW